MYHLMRRASIALLLAVACQVQADEPLALSPSVPVPLTPPAPQPDLAAPPALSPDADANATLVMPSQMAAPAPSIAPAATPSPSSDDPAPIPEVASSPSAPPPPPAPPPQRIGVVDLDRLIIGSRLGKRLIAPLDVLLKQRQDEARVIEKQLDDLRFKVEKENLTASDRQRRAWQREFDDKLQQLRQFDLEVTREIDQGRAEAIGEFMRIAKPEIEALGKKLGLSLILRKEVALVLYSEEAIDLSASMIERLDALKDKP